MNNILTYVQIQLLGFFLWPCKTFEEIQVLFGLMNCRFEFLADQYDKTSVSPFSITAKLGLDKKLE